MQGCFLWDKNNIIKKEEKGEKMKVKNPENVTLYLDEVMRYDGVVFLNFISEKKTI